jgi:hypothetical protein
VGNEDSILKACGVSLAKAAGIIPIKSHEGISHHLPSLFLNSSTIPEAKNIMSHRYICPTVCVENFGLPSPVINKNPGFKLSK